jgi:hypothetical protein
MSRRLSARLRGAPKQALLVIARRDLALAQRLSRTLLAELTA